MSRKRAKKLVVVSDDYLDGISGVSWREPSEYDESGRKIDPALLAALDMAWSEYHRIGREVLAAWGDAPDTPNPKFVPYEATESGR